MKWWVVPVLVAGCHGSSDKPADQPAPSPAPPADATPEPGVSPARGLAIRWLDVRATGSCFYFSGPDGRDDKLVGAVTVIDRAELGDGTITIAINGVPFEGTYRNKQLAVKRVSEHVFGGPWTATEEIRGTFTDRDLVGTYSYRECEHGQPCPGRCTLDADIRFER